MGREDTDEDIGWWFMSPSYQLRVKNKSDAVQTQATQFADRYKDSRKKNGLYECFVTRKRAVGSIVGFGIKSWKELSNLMSRSSWDRRWSLKVTSWKWSAD